MPYDLVQSLRDKCHFRPSSNRPSSFRKDSGGNPMSDDDQLTISASDGSAAGCKSGSRRVFGPLATIVMAGLCTLVLLVASVQPVLAESKEVAQGTPDLLEEGVSEFLTDQQIGLSAAVVDLVARDLQGKARKTAPPASLALVP